MILAVARLLLALTAHAQFDRQAQHDGLFIVLGECDTAAESVAPGLGSLAYESCLDEHGMNGP